MKEALKLALEALENHEGNYKLGNAGCDRLVAAITAIKEALAQPDYRAVKTYHEGKPVYVSQTEFPPECKTVAEQTAYAFGWWKALESVRTEQPAQEPVASITKEARGTLILHLGWDDLPNGTKFYTTPQQRPWVGLTGQEQALIASVSKDVPDAIYRANAKLKEKNT